MLNSSFSRVRALLAIPSIGAEGITHSIVFPQLPTHAQAAIRQAATEQQKIAIAATAGDDLPVIAEMFQHYAVAPMQRKQQMNLAEFPLPGVVQASDSTWLRQGMPISRIEPIFSDNIWGIRVVYNDAEIRQVAEKFDSESAMEQRLQEVKLTAYIFGLTENTPCIK